MEIFSARPEHLPLIQRMARSTWPSTFGDILSPAQIEYMLEWMYSLPALSEQINQRGHVFLLAREADEFWGYLSYELHYGGQPRMKIHKLYVLPQAQGRGIGQALLDAAAQQARVAGNTAVLLNVNRQNRAVGFYERAGFRVVRTEDIDIGNGFLMEDFVMHYDLNQP